MERTAVTLGLAVLVSSLTSSGARAQAPAAVAAPPGAAAPAEDPKDAARAKLIEGSELLKQGDYEQALARFQAAHDLVQSPKIFYNFGLAYIGLGRKVEAIESFEKFLDEANDASPDLRANAERHRSALAVQTGAVVVQADVDGAEVSVDGRSHGVTPLRRPVRLNPGPHSLVVEKAGTPPFAQKLSVDAGQKITVEVKLAPAAVAAADPAGGAGAGVAPGGAAIPADGDVPGRGWKWKAAWGTGIGAAVLLAFGVTEQVVASGHYADFNSYVPTSGYGRCDADPRVRDYGGPGCAALLADGDSASSLARVGFIAGGILAAGSVTLFVLSHLESRAAGGGATAPTSTSFVCVPSVVPQAGVGCGMRF